jgi:hypothetical protein
LKNGIVYETACIIEYFTCRLIGGGWLESLRLVLIFDLALISDLVLIFDLETFPGL